MHIAMREGNNWVIRYVSNLPNDHIEQSFTGMLAEAVIEFGTLELDGKPVYFVRDNGAGFDQPDADRLFMPFQRLPGAEKFKGFGIGLATVERIIQRHGGRIWAEGEPGNGAAIYFTLAEPEAQGK